MSEENNISIEENDVSTDENIASPLDEILSDTEPEQTEPEADETQEEETKSTEDKPYWYVVHTYSGYENKVKANLEKTVENRNMQDRILEIKVPMEDTIEIKNGKRKTVARKVYPGYVMVKMILTDESWYVVRNTRGVTGFVGPGSRPIPLTDEEVRMTGVEDVAIVLDVEVGQNVTVTSGPLENFVGVIEEINQERQKLKVSVSMFGRDTQVELDFVQVKKI